MNDHRRRKTDQPEFVRRLAGAIYSELAEAQFGMIDSWDFLDVGTGASTPEAERLRVVLARALLVAMTNDAKGEE